MKNNEALQVQYTSCRRGQSAGKGFQTRWADPAVEQQELREIESRGSYVAPRGLSSTPSREEIEREFPVSFRFYTLPTGRFAITKSQYVGQDYTLRWGNFFAHTLVADVDGMSYPMNYYEWNGWKGCLDADEDTDLEPLPLAPVDLSRISPSQSFSLEELQEFLREKPGRVEFLAKMIGAVFYGRPLSRSLVVRDSPINGVFWLACVQRAFPLRLALTLSLSTFQFDPRDCAALNATTIGTDFTFDETQRRFQFCMFDLIEGHASDIPVDSIEYGAVLAQWLAEKPQSIEAFHEFVGQTTASGVDYELVQLLRAFRIVEGEALTISAQEAFDALGRAWRASPADRRVKLMPGIERLSDHLAVGGTTQQLLELFRLTVESRRAVVQTWLRCFGAVVSASRWDRLPVLGEARDIIAADSLQSEREIAEQLLSGRGMTALLSATATLGDATPEAVEWFFDGVLRSTRSLGRTLDDPSVRGIVDAMPVSADTRIEKIAAILRPLAGNVRGIVAACMTLSAKCGDEGVGRALHRVIVSERPSSAAEIHAVLDHGKAVGILRGEWYAIRERSAAEPSHARYDEVRSLLLNATPNFDRAERGNIARWHAEAACADERRGMALTWLRTAEIDRFDGETQRWCVAEAADALPRSYGVEVSGNDAIIVASYAKRVGLAMKPNRSFLHGMINDLGSTKQPDEARYRGMQDALENIDAGEYAGFLHAFLPLALRGARSPQEHEELIASALVRNEKEAFAKAYLSAITAKGRAALPVAALDTLITYWLSGGAGDSLERFGLVNSVSEALTTRLCALRRGEFESLQKSVIFPSGSPGRAKWQRIQDEVAQRNKSIFGRVHDMLQRKER